MPCAHFVPDHPVKDAMGRARPWDQKAHDRFQQLLADHGDPGLHAFKRAVVASITAGKAPSAIAVPSSRAESHVLKAALRQIAMSPDRPSEFSVWLQAFDDRRTAEGEQEEGCLLYTSRCV